MSHRINDLTAALTLSSAGTYVVAGSAKGSIDLMNAVVLQLTSDVHVTFGTAIQIIAVGVGIVGLLIKGVEMTKNFKEKHKNKKGK